jgi:5'-methylthioadenosine phosphorylase
LARIGFITGSGFYEMLRGDGADREVVTPYGAVTVRETSRHGHAVLALSRHGADHHRLSNHVKHRPNFWALHELGAQAILASTAVGVLDTAVPLGVPILFNDLYFPSNRMPDGSLATFFTEAGDPRRGHWIPTATFSPTLRELLIRAGRDVGLAVVTSGCYTHADGPRFNTRPEHAAMRAAGGTAVSQTCGPEAVLAGELQIPYALVGFGVNYADAPGAPTTPPGEVAALLRKHAEVMTGLFEAFLGLVPADQRFTGDTGSVYRMVP